MNVHRMDETAVRANKTHLERLAQCHMDRFSRWIGFAIDGEIVES